jgi:hypothetical protein
MQVNHFRLESPKKRNTTDGKYILFQTVEYSWNHGCRIGCCKAEIIHIEEDRIISKVNESGLNRKANRDSMGHLSRSVV